MKTAIITGASTGIGRNLAFMLAGLGFHLGIIARRSDLLDELSRSISKKYPHIQVHQASVDVSQIEATALSIKTIAQNLGQLDLMIANAGIGYPTPAFRNNRNEVLQIFQVNTLGAINSLEAAKEIMLSQGFGHLVGISSIASQRGLPTSSAYCSSKAALSTYLESLRLDLKRKNIFVTTIQPGFIQTPMTQKNKRMPFVLSGEKGSQKILEAIFKRKARYTFPWPMAFLTWIIHHMPDFLYDWMMSFYDA